jgi:glucosamine kinase
MIVLGVDGGASSTTCAVVDGSGRVRGVGRGGPVDHLYRAAGRERARRGLVDAISAARSAAALRRPIDAVVAGITGLDPDAAESGVAVKMLRDATRARIIRATWDGHIAFAGAVGGGNGIVIIAGTGSVAVGRNAKGQMVRAGGHGYLIDDAGGGMRIGQAGLRAAMRAADGYGPATHLLPMMTVRLGAWSEIRERVYGEGGGRTLLASLAPVVEAAARRGDRVARGILGDAGRALGELVLAVAARLEMLATPFPLYAVGGVFTMGPLVLNPLRRTVRARAPRCVLRPPRFPPVIGAALMALEAAGVRVTPDVMRTLRLSSQGRLK